MMMTIIYDTGASERSVYTQWHGHDTWSMQFLK